jgi:hypothetical protein
VNDVGADQRQFLATGLQAGVTYTAQVRAMNGAEASDWSAAEGTAAGTPATDPGDGTGTGGDTGPVELSLLTSSPAAGATAVARGTSVAMTLGFDVTGVDARTVRLLRSDGSVVSSVVTHDRDERRITIDPRGKLPVGSTVRVVLEGLRDDNGRSIARTVWRFTTRDDVKPRVVKSQPRKGTPVARGANLRMWVSEPVRGVNRGSVELRAGNRKVAAKVTYAAQSRVVVVDPARRLAPRARYTLVVKPAVRDLAGNPMVRTVWKFRAR